MKTRLHCAALLCTILFNARAEPAVGPDWYCGFEEGLGDWTMDYGDKQPLVISGEPVFAGKGSAYSGPPGKNRVGRHGFSPPLTGRVEIRFYDDLAPGKQQIAGVTGRKGGLLAVIARQPGVYEFRIGGTYTATGVDRSKGWHLFAWECDGMATTAFVDGKPVAANPDMDRIAALVIGSFWNASTGWYDEAKAWRRPPTRAPAFVEAEEFFAEYGSPGAAVQIVRKRDASGKAIKNWDRPGHALEWSLAAQKKPACLLIRHASATAAVRKITIGETTLEHRFPPTGGWDRWRATILPVSVTAGVHAVRMENVEGSLNLDWLALVSTPDDPQAYARDLHAYIASRQRRARAVAMTRRAAERAGVEIALDDEPVADRTELPDADALHAWVAAGNAPLTEARRKVLAVERKRLDTEFRAVKWRMPSAETALCREYFGRLENYLKLTVPRFRDWPYAPGCRYHKQEGSQEWDVRQNAAVAYGYAVLLSGPYDENRTGISRQALRRDLTALLRTLAITHTASFLPTSDGKPWGDQWQSAFWASIAGQAAWLVWPTLPDDVRSMTARVI